MDDIDDGLMDGGESFRTEQDERESRAIQPNGEMARLIYDKQGRLVARITGPELKGEALRDFAAKCYQRALRSTAADRAAKADKEPAIRKWLRAFGLASNDPANLDEYAIEAGIDPDIMREALGADAGAKLGLVAEVQMRNSGELAHVAFSRTMHKMVAAVDKGHKDGTVSAVAASKIIDEYGKFRERAIEASKVAAIAVPQQFTGTAEQLIAEILDHDKPIREPRAPWD